MYINFVKESKVISLNDEPLASGNHGMGLFCLIILLLDLKNKIYAVRVGMVP